MEQRLGGRFRIRRVLSFEFAMPMMKILLNETYNKFRKNCSLSGKFPIKMI